MSLKKKLFDIWQLVPEDVRIPIDILRRLPRWKKEGIIFIHVPKNAGFSFSQALYGRPLGHFRAYDVRKVCPKSFLNLFTFGVVRHPISRLYSAYKFAVNGGTLNMGIKDSQKYQSNAFSSFDHFVVDWLTKQTLTNIDGIFQPQYFFLCDNEKIIVDEILYFEKFNNKKKILLDKKKKEIVLDVYNKSTGKQLGKCSKETIQIIHKIYQKDFEIFKYK